MKRVTSLLLCLFITYVSYSQTGTGIGTLTPDPSAILDIVSASKGTLLPRIALKSRKSPLPISKNTTKIPNSLLVYNTATINGLEEGYYFWLKNKWNKIATKSELNILQSERKASNGLTLIEKNNFKLGGTLTEPTTINTNKNSLNITGTTANAFSVNDNTLSVNAESNRVGIGTNTPSTSLDISGTLRIADGTEGEDKVLTSDAHGNASWKSSKVNTSPTIVHIPRRLEIPHANVEERIYTGSIMSWKTDIDGEEFRVITLPENGIYIFSFRLYGIFIGKALPQKSSNICLLSVWCHQELRDLAEIVLMKGENSTSYSVNLIVTGKKEEQLMFRIAQKESGESQWALLGSSSKDHYGGSTSMVYWKL